MKKLATLLISLCCLSVNANMFEANKALNEKDYTTALSELTKSAQIGNAEAQFKLGVMLYQGQAGKVDVNQAIAWLFLASEYEFPNAIQLASKTFQELSSEEQNNASKVADSLMAKFSKKQLELNIYPKIEDRPLKAQKFSKPAKISKRVEPRMTGLAARTQMKNISRYSTAVRDQRTNGGAIANAVNNRSVFPAGLATARYDIGPDGKTNDVEIIFSWPRGVLDNIMIDYVERTEFTPAYRDEQAVSVYGRIHGLNTWSTTAGNLRDGYPAAYKRFRSVKRSAKDNINDKYTYACYLRGYKKMLSKSEYEPFAPLLLEAAEAGHTLAQYDYALHQMFQKRKLKEGLPWLIKAAKTGLVEAEYTLGDIFYQSPFPLIKQDSGKAKLWLEKAAKQGHEKAQEKLNKLKELS
jgi:TPR repeat protein